MYFISSGWRVEVMFHILTIPVLFSNCLFWVYCDVAHSVFVIMLSLFGHAALEVSLLMMQSDRLYAGILSFHEEQLPTCHMVTFCHVQRWGRLLLNISSWFKCTRQIDICFIFPTCLRCQQHSTPAVCWVVKVKKWVFWQPCVLNTQGLHRCKCLL